MLVPLVTAMTTTFSLRVMFSCFVVSVTLIMLSVTAYAMINGREADGSIFGIVDADGTATMLRNEWLLTAKHLHSAAEHESFMSQVVVERIEHPDLDVAVFRLGNPLTVAGVTEGYMRPLSWIPFRNYTDQNVLCGGYGIYRRDRPYLRSAVWRTALLPVYNADVHSIMGWPDWSTVVRENEEGQMISYGDSGSSCFQHNSTWPKSNLHRMLGVASSGSSIKGFYIDQAYFREWVTEATTDRQIRMASGKCLTMDIARDGPFAAGCGALAPENIPFPSKNRQRWRVISNLDGEVQIRRRNDYEDLGGDYCLTMDILKFFVFPTPYGDFLTFNSCNFEQAAGQFWTVVELKTHKGEFSLKMTENGKSVCVTEQDGDVVAGPCDYGLERTHLIYFDENVVYPPVGENVKQRFRFPFNRCLSSSTWSLATFANCDFSDESQEWIVEEQAGGVARIRSADNGTCLTAPYNIFPPYDITTPQLVLLRDCNGQSLQNWSLDLRPKVDGRIALRPAGSQYIVSLGNYFAGNLANLMPVRSGVGLSEVAVDYGLNTEIAPLVHIGEIHRLSAVNLDASFELDPISTLETKSEYFTLYEPHGTAISGRLVSEVRLLWDGNYRFDYRLEDLTIHDSRYDVVRLVLEGYDRSPTRIGYAVDDPTTEIGPTTVRRTQKQLRFDFTEQRPLPGNPSATVFTLPQALDYKTGSAFLVAEDGNTGRLYTVAIGVLAPDRLVNGYIR